MVFVTLQAFVFHSAACCMEEWPQDILSAQSLNVVMLVLSDLLRAIQDFEKWEMCSADLGENVVCGISVTLCSMLRKICGRMELCVSSIRIFKWCFSTYGGFNVLLQSAQCPGFRMLFNVLQGSGRAIFNSCSTERVLYDPHAVHYWCFVMKYACSPPRYSKEAKSNKSRTGSWLLLWVELFTLHSTNM